MIMARRVALNGVWLDEIDSRIFISGVEPGDGKENITAVDSAAGYGQRITARWRQTMDIIIRFRMLEHGKNVTGLTERALLLERVNSWAQAGGYLTLNYKPNRRLNVVLAQPPGEGSLWDYTKEFSLTFRAYAIPYWEDENANSVTFGGASASGSRSVTIEGSAKTQCEVELANASGMTINSGRVVIGGNTMTFSGLGLGGNETLVIDHADGLVRIRIRNGGSYRSVMAARSGADDFKVTPGAHTCSFSADRACRMTVSWRNRYL